MVDGKLKTYRLHTLVSQRARIKYGVEFQFYFCKKYLEYISPFRGATDTPVLDFWRCLLWVSKPEWAALFALGGGIGDVHSLKFTSGVTPPNLLAANMAADRFPTCMFQQR